MYLGHFLFHLIVFVELEPSQFPKKGQHYFYLELTVHFGEFPSAALEQECIDSIGHVQTLLDIPRLQSALSVYKVEGKRLKYK